MTHGRTRRDALLALAVAILVGLGLWWALSVRGSAVPGAPTRGDVRGAEPPAPAVASPGLEGRPVAPVAPEAPSPAAAREEARAALPGGALRVVLRISPTVKDVGGVRVTRGGTHEAMFVWRPNSPKTPWIPYWVEKLGRHAELHADTPSEAATEVSFLLTDIDDGMYVVQAASATVIVVVGVDEGATAVLTIPPDVATLLTVRARRDGKGEKAFVTVLFHEVTLGLFEVSADASTAIAVPAGIDLDVRVESFQGSELFAPPAPQRVRLAAGEKKTVTFDLAVGIEVMLDTVGPRGAEAQGFPTLWRILPGGVLSYVTGLMSFTTHQSPWRGRLPPGRYAMSLANGIVRGVTEFDVAPPGPVTVRLAVEAESGRRLRLRAVEADGAPSKDLSVTVVREGAKSIGEIWNATVKTDAQGLATTPPLQPATYGFFLWNRLLHRRFVVTEGTEEIAMRLPPAPSADGPVLRVRIRPPEGSPKQNGISGAVIVTAQDAEWGRLGTIDGTGVYAVRGLPSGVARLEIQFSWYARVPYRAHEEPVRVFADDTQPIEVELRAP